MKCKSDVLGFKNTVTMKLLVFYCVNAPLRKV